MFVSDCFRKVKERLGREASATCGKGRESAVLKARREFVVEKLKLPENKTVPEFDIDWYPKYWLLFVYKGVASEDREDGVHNPFKPRSAAQTEDQINFTLDETINHHNASVSKSTRRITRDTLTASEANHGVVAVSSNDHSKTIVHNIVHTHTVSEDANLSGSKGTEKEIEILERQLKFYEERSRGRNTAFQTDIEEVESELNFLYREQLKSIRQKRANATSVVDTTPQHQRLVRPRETTDS